MTAALFIAILLICMLADGTAAAAFSTPRAAMKLQRHSSSYSYSSAFVTNRRSSFAIYLQSIDSSGGFYTEEDEDDNSDMMDMRELKARIEKQTNQYFELLQNNDFSERPKPTTVNIIVFNPASPNQQGVHTIEYPKGSGNNTILAFESPAECERFAQLLKDMQFYEPVPQSTSLEQLEIFCQGLGVPVQVVPKGFDLTPPADNVNELNYEPGPKPGMNVEEMMMQDEDLEEDVGSWE